MTSALGRDILKKAVLAGSLASVGIVLGVAILVLISQFATYGIPVKLLVSFALIVAIVVRRRHTVNKRTGQPKRWEHSWWMASFAVAAVFLLANQLIVRGLAVGIWDADGEMFPFQVLVSDFARSGRFIHWDPWSDGGLPLSGDPSVGAFSPLNLMVGLITGGTSLGFRVYWLLTWALGGIGVILLARQLKAPAWAGALVAIGFLFNGTYTGNAQHTSCVVGFSFLPLIIWRLDNAIVSRRIAAAAEAGALWGLSALSGYPAITVMSGFFCALWAIGRIAFPEKDTSEFAHKDEGQNAWSKFRDRGMFLLTVLSVLLIVGLAVLSPTYYAFFAEGVGTNARSGPLPREVALLSNALEPGALSTLASPYLAALKAANQLHGDGQLWPKTDLSECSIYSGAAVTVFAVLSLLARPKTGWRWWLALVACLSLICALSASLPVRGWLYDWIYPMRFFRHAAFFAFYFVFMISAMALLGLRDLHAAANRGITDPVWRRFKVASLVCAAIAFTTFLSVIGYLGAERSISLKQAPITWLIVSGGWLAILGLATIMGTAPAPISARYFPVILIAIVASDAFLTCSVSQANMISTEADDLARWQSLDQRHSSLIDLTHVGLMREPSPCESNDIANNRPFNNLNPVYRCPFSDQLITKVPVLESYSTMPNPFLLRIAAHPTLKNMAVGSERVWFCGEAIQVPLTEACFAAFTRRAEILAAPPLVTHSPENIVKGRDLISEVSNKELDLIAQLPACSRVSCSIQKYYPEELLFEVTCPSDGWLLVTDRWGSAWRAEVNSKVTEVLPGNFVFRAIRVAEGVNRIRFTYHPPLFPWLIILSWATLGVTALRAASRIPRKLTSGGEPKLHTN
jgi:hypothetical protein